MDEQDLEIIREFVLESNENLGKLDQDIVALEGAPRDADLLASVFRTMHTLKGTCGFLGYSSMESVAHHAENILSQLRSGKRMLDNQLTTVILEAVDMIRIELAAVEATGAETGALYPELLERLQLAERAPASAGAPPPAAVPPAVAAAPRPEPVTPPADGVVTPVVRPSGAAPASPRPGIPAPDAITQAVAKAVTDTAIRVDVHLLDSLMNLVGELVLARNQIVEFISGQEDPALNASSQRLDVITSELQEGVMKTRMQPIGVVWNKLPRVVRDIAAAVGKQIRLEMEGAETELDKTIIEAIKDPLTHIVRNSCDHGIEEPDQRLTTGKPPQGRLVLRAFHEGGHVNIEVHDDGRGIDPDRVRRRALERGLLTEEAAGRLGDREALLLIFAPGFSTAETVSNLSGRGVGMDVVRTNIEKIGGSVEVNSQPGEGTTVRLRIPLTLAIIPGLIVTNADERYVIPQVSLLELIRLEGQQVRQQVQQIHGIPVYRRRGALLPLAFLADLFRTGAERRGVYRRRAGDQPTETAARASHGADVLNIVVLQAESQQFGLVVDGIHDTQEIVVKPLSPQLKGLNCYAGATILGDGNVALILDIPGLAHLSGVLKRNPPHAETGGFDTGLVANTQSYLVFAGASEERLAVPLDLVARLEEIPSDKVERAAGQLAVQYRDGILPLVSVQTLLDQASREPALPPLLRVVVFADGGRSVGLLVDEILDIVEGDSRKWTPSHRPGILASFVLDGKVTDLLDLRQLLRQPHLHLFGDASATGDESFTVLLIEEKPLRRGILRTALQVQGYQLREAATAEEAIRGLEQQGIDAVLVSQSLPAADRDALQLWIDGHRDEYNLQVLALDHTATHTADAPPPQPYHAWADMVTAPGVVDSLLRLRNSLCEEKRPAADKVLLEDPAGA